jgi:hypothetical protein
MRDFLVSLISLGILLGIVWTVVFGVLILSESLISFGMPVEAVWFTFGACVLLCKPGEALASLSSRIWIFIDKINSSIP